MQLCERKQTKTIKGVIIVREGLADRGESAVIQGTPGGFLFHIFLML